MRIVLYVNHDKDPNFTVSKKAEDVLLAAGHSPVRCTGDPSVFKGAGAALSLGGDGTFLRCAKLAMPYDVPVLGVHLGHTGFLSRVQPDKLSELSGISSFILRERSVLAARIRQNETVLRTMTAVNDFVFSRGASVQTVSLELTVDGHNLGSFLGDGVIISSATGSTGYALSAGGPVADPSLRILMITPICAHTSHDHAFVLSGERNLTVAPSQAERRTIYLSADGEEPVRLQPGETAEIFASEQTLRCLEPPGHDFFENVKIHRM